MSTGQMVQMVLPVREQIRCIKISSFTPFGYGLLADVGMERFSAVSSIAQKLYIATMQQNELLVLIIILQDRLPQQREKTHQPTHTVLPRSLDAMCFVFSTGAPASHPKLYMPPQCPTSHHVLPLSIPADRQMEEEES